jgi:hypothetical protein
MKIVKEDLNSFVRNQDPIKALKLGYAAKIRSFFREYNIPDEDYIIKEDNEIVFNKTLDLFNTEINELPDNLTINGDFILSQNPIKNLPNNLKVTSDLFIHKTLITELLGDLIVGKDLYLGDNIITKISDQMIVKRYIHANHPTTINLIKQSKFKDILNI